MAIPAPFALLVPSPPVELVLHAPLAPRKRLVQGPQQQTLEALQLLHVTCACLAMVERAAVTAFKVRPPEVLQCTKALGVIRSTSHCHEETPTA